MLALLLGTPSSYSTLQYIGLKDVQPGCNNDYFVDGKHKVTFE